MKRRRFLKTVPAFAMITASASVYSNSVPIAVELRTIVLPAPEKEGGKSVLTSLIERKTTRLISPKELPIQVLSNLLWAGFGVNRETGSFNKNEGPPLRQAIRRK